MLDIAWWDWSAEKMAANISLIKAADVQTLAKLA